MSLENSVLAYANRILPWEVLCTYDIIEYAQFSELKFTTTDELQAYMAFQLLQEFYVTKYSNFDRKTSLAPKVRSEKEQELYALLFRWHACIQTLRTPNLSNSHEQRKKLVSIENELHRLAATR